MTDKQIEQRWKLLEDQLTLGVWYEKEFREKLGNKGYQDFIDNIFDEMIFLRKQKEK